MVKPDTKTYSNLLRAMDHPLRFRLVAADYITELIKLVVDKVHVHLLACIEMSHRSVSVRIDAISIDVSVALLSIHRRWALAIYAAVRIVCHVGVDELSRADYPKERVQARTLRMVESFPEFLE